MQIALCWLLRVCVCSLGWRSSVVTCEALIAARSGIASSSCDVWRLGLARNLLFSRTKHKVAPGVDVGTLVVRWVRYSLVCARFILFALGRVLHRKVEFRGANITVMAASGLWLQSWLTRFYCDLLGADCSSQRNCFVELMFGGFWRLGIARSLCCLAQSGSSKFVWCGWRVFWTRVLNELACQTTFWCSIMALQHWSFQRIHGGWAGISWDILKSSIIKEPVVQLILISRKWNCIFSYIFVIYSVDTSLRWWGTIFVNHYRMLMIRFRDE